jgi:hypothetical protein
LSQSLVCWAAHHDVTTLVWYESRRMWMSQLGPSPLSMMQVKSTHRQEERQHLLPTFVGRKCCLSRHRCRVPSPCASRERTSTSADRNTSAAASVHLWPPAAHASGRRWLHQSHLARISGGVCPRRKAALTACQIDRKAPADV